jgi:hypothetical protein
MRVAPAPHASPPKRPKYAVMPRELVENPELSDAACRLFAALDAATIGQQRQITLHRMAEQLGWSRSKMTRAVRELTDAGLMETDRTWRSPKVTVHNPVRQASRHAAARSGTPGEPTGTASPATQEPPEWVTSDALEDGNCVIGDAPIQEYKRINNKQSNSGSAAARRDAAIAIRTDSAPEIPAAAEIEKYLAEITARTGHRIEANKITGPLIAAIAARKLSPTDTAQLVDAQLAAAGSGVRNPSGFIVKVVLPGLADKPLPETPRAPSQPPTVAEIFNGPRCEHGAEIGRCGFCREADRIARERAEIDARQSESPSRTVRDCDTHHGEDCDGDWLIHHMLMLQSKQPMAAAGTAA